MVLLDASIINFQHHSDPSNLQIPSSHWTYFEEWKPSYQKGAAPNRSALLSSLVFCLTTHQSPAFKTVGEPQSIQVEDWEISFAELNLS